MRCSLTKNCCKRKRNGPSQCFSVHFCQSVYGSHGIYGNFPFPATFTFGFTIYCGGTSSMNIFMSPNRQHTTVHNTMLSDCTKESVKLRFVNKRYLRIRQMAVLLQLANCFGVIRLCNNNLLLSRRRLKISNSSSTFDLSARQWVSGEFEVLPFWNYWPEPY